jgi:signal transduction histidine kinase
MMAKKRKIEVLLVEDDEDDYTLVRDLLSEVKHVEYEVQWVPKYEEALKAIEEPTHDVCLLDYRLGERNGLDLLYEAIGRSYCVPIVFVTGQGDFDVDMEAMKAGAADFLVKGQINGPLLDRSIRYAIEQRKILENLRESEGQCRLLSSQLLAAQETERRNIAREIHDSIGQTLAAIKFGAENALEKIRRGDSGGAAEKLGNVVSMLQYASAEVRRIQMDLRPSMLDDLGILVTLNWFCREFEKIYSTIRVERRIGIEEEEIPQPLKITLYRIIQEAFNNIAKHSKGNRAVLSLEGNRSKTVLTIEDNGQGFDPEEARTRYRKGMGLSSMRERAELSGGSFAVESARGKGTTLRVSWEPGGATKQA